jgi:hypothetical protein
MNLGELAHVHERHTVQRFFMPRRRESNGAEIPLRKTV